MSPGWLALAILVVLALENAAIWGLFWRRGWRIMTPTAQKHDPQRDDAAQDPGALATTVPPASAPVPLSTLDRETA